MLVFVVLAPGVVFGVLALLWLLGWVPAERVVSRITGVTFSACVFRRWPCLLWTLAATGAPAVVVTFGNWFAVHDYRFPLVLMADRLSLPFLGMTVVLSGLIGQFSATYLHRERGFLRFFLLLHLFAFGSLLAFAAGSFDLLVGGWETGGHHLGTADRVLPAASGPGGKRAARLRCLSRLRHRIAGGRVRHASIGPERRRLPTVFPALTGAQRVHRLPASAACSCREGRAGSVLGMAAARHGGPDAIERHLLRRDLDSRRRISPAPSSTAARAIARWPRLW